jgi:hypothetical protein
METSLPAVIQRLLLAWNAHDDEAVADCLLADYQSQQPLHPERNFSGRGVARQSWSAIFNALPSFRAELLGYAVNGSRVWTEWRWRGDHADGPAFRAGGVMIFDLNGDHIASVRAYTETQTLACPDFDQILDDILRET